MDIVTLNNKVKVDRVQRHLNWMWFEFWCFQVYVYSIVVSVHFCPQWPLHCFETGGRAIYSELQKMRMRLSKIQHLLQTCLMVLLFRSSLRGFLQPVNQFLRPATRCPPFLSSVPASPVHLLVPSFAPGPVFLRFYHLHVLLLSINNK